MPTETKWTLSTPDGKIIYGVKNAADKPAKAAIFMVHGLSSSMYDYNFKRAADVLSGLGYDVYRFNLYDGEKQARRLTECTLLTHAEDVNTVMGEFAGSYDKNFIVGHSYGGPTVMLANPEKLTAASLWDPSYNIKKMNEDFSECYGKIDNFITINWGVSFLLNPAMEKHATTLDEVACIKLSTNFNTPVQVVLAGDGYYVKQDTSYHSHGKPENLPHNRRDVVQGTTHCFYEGDTCEELLAKTHAFFQSFHKANAPASLPHKQA